MNPHSGMAYQMFGSEGGDPPGPGAKMSAEAALANGTIRFDDLDLIHRRDFEEMLRDKIPLVAVDDTAARKLQLGEDAASPETFLPEQLVSARDFQRSLKDVLERLRKNGKLLVALRGQPVAILKALPEPPEDAA